MYFSYYFQIEHIKEILLSGNHEMLIGKNARRMMMQLSIPIDEDIQQTLSFFEKVKIVFLIFFQVIQLFLNLFKLFSAIKSCEF